MGVCIGRTWPNAPMWSKTGVITRPWGQRMTFDAGGANFYWATYTSGTAQLPFRGCDPGWYGQNWWNTTIEEVGLYCLIGNWVADFGGPWRTYLWLENALGDYVYWENVWETSIPPLAIDLNLVEPAAPNWLLDFDGGARIAAVPYFRLPADFCEPRR